MKDFKRFRLFYCFMYHTIILSHFSSALSDFTSASNKKQFESKFSLSYALNR